MKHNYARRNMKSYLVLLMVCLGFTGCATRPSKLAVESRARIAVVSCLPELLSVHSMGIVPAIQSEQLVDARFINVRRESQEIAESHLLNKGYRVVPPSSELRAEVTKVIRSGEMSGGFQMGTEFRNDYDVIVIISSEAGRSLSGSETGFGGVELIPSRIFGLKTLIASCNLKLNVFNIGGSAAIYRGENTGSFLEIKSTPWRGRWSDFSDSERQAIRLEIIKALNSAIGSGIDKIL